MKTAGISRREWHMLYIIYQHLQYIDSVHHAYIYYWLTWKFCFWNFRFNIQMPSIIKGSISILSDAGLGMAMFSLGTPLAFWCLFIIRLLEMLFTWTEKLNSIWRCNIWPRSVHGSATKDHLLWQEGGDVRHGGEIFDWSGSDRGYLHRHWAPGSAPARCHRSGLHQHHISCSNFQAFLRGDKWQSYWLL